VERRRPTQLSIPCESRISGKRSLGICCAYLSRVASSFSVTLRAHYRSASRLTCVLLIRKVLANRDAKLLLHGCCICDAGT
jgi:hypothetical protein